MSRSGTVSDKKRVLNWVHENKGGESSEVGLASSLYKACLRTLGLLSKHYLARTKPSRERKARIVESYTRLCLFGDELLHEGALEHCLKGDNDLRDEVISLLYSLGKALLRGAENLYNVQDRVDSKTKAELVLGLAELVENASTVVSQQGRPGGNLLSNSDSSEDEASDVECDIKRLTEDDYILSALDTYTTSLMDLGPVLEQSLRDLSKPSARRAGILPPEFQVTDSARPYVLQVHDKFRDARSALVERLGEANWQRYMKIKAMMAAPANKDNPAEMVPESSIPEVPKSTFRPVSLFHDSGLGTSSPNRSRYAASNASHTSFLSTETDASKARSRVPSTPMEVSKGKAFICFICTQRLSGIRNRVDWKMHVFADLHPYICTFPECPDVLTTYPTRKLWAEHEFTIHRSHQQYECHDCSHTFSTENKFVAHINNDHHFGDLNHTQRLATVSAAKKSVIKSFDDQVCPLCKKTGWKLQRDFTTHLGRHLEEIALSSLPRDEDSGSESDSNTDLGVVDDPVPWPDNPASSHLDNPQITSYWSVPEQQKFPDLIKYFGRDFAAIADFMKTKSSTMIKNFYTRELNIGKKELEDAAKSAEGMRERGEPMGPPPTPIAPPRRRYEATPSMASLPRPLTNLDIAAPDSMHEYVAQAQQQQKPTAYPPEIQVNMARIRDHRVVYHTTKVANDRYAGNLQMINKQEHQDIKRLAVQDAQTWARKWQANNNYQAQAGQRAIVQQHAQPMKRKQSKPTDGRWSTGLARACGNGDLAAVRARYAESPEDSNTADSGGFTPIHIGASAGSVEVVKFLLENGCEIDTRNNKMETPLIIAIQNEHVEVVRLLLQAGANPWLGDRNGANSYQLVPGDGSDSEEIRKLIREAMAPGSPPYRALDVDESYDIKRWSIECICGYADDDGDSILCETCDTRQHIECYYKRETVPDMHFCADCRPRELDFKTATEHQKTIREAFSRQPNSYSSMPPPAAAPLPRALRPAGLTNVGEQTEPFILQAGRRAGRRRRDAARPMHGRGNL